MASLSKADIVRLFELLNDELRAASVSGELYLVGGAVMCIALNARDSTLDVDAFFKPTREIREAAARVAAKVNVDENWLNDGVKGFIGTQTSFSHYLDSSHLKVYCARPDYLLAMKCLAMRIGEEFQDLDDVRYLLRHLDLRSYQDALEVIRRYYPLERFPQKTLYALEEILEGTS